jgi:hypothetical protein
MAGFTALVETHCDYHSIQQSQMPRETGFGCPKPLTLHPPRSDGLASMAVQKSLKALGFQDLDIGG